MFLDASALLAYLLHEPGQAKVLEAIAAGVQMTTINFAEVAGRYVANGASDDQVRALRSRLPFELVPVDDEIAIRAGLLVAAQIAGQGVLTADRVWASGSAAIGVPVHLVR